jgi:predicted RNA polymerase sigma factor
LLVAIAPSPIVSLNSAVAVAKVHGLDAGLAALAEIDGSSTGLGSYHLLPAARAQFLWSKAT